jgi:hypothetical protein
LALSVMPGNRRRKAAALTAKKWTTRSRLARRSRSVTADGAYDQDGVYDDVAAVACRGDRAAAVHGGAE